MFLAASISAIAFAVTSDEAADVATAVEEVYVPAVVEEILDEEVPVEETSTEEPAAEEVASEKVPAEEAVCDGAAVTVEANAVAAATGEELIEATYIDIMPLSGVLPEHVAAVVVDGTDANDIGFPTLHEATLAALDGATVRLVTDVSEAEVRILDKSLTIDLAGYTLTLTGAPIPGHPGQQNSVYVGGSDPAPRTLTITNGTVDFTGMIFARSGNPIGAVGGPSTVNIEAPGTITSFSNRTIFAREGSTVNFNGSVANTSVQLTTVAVFAHGGSTINVNGAVTSNFNGVAVQSGSSSVNIAGDINAGVHGVTTSVAPLISGGPLVNASVEVGGDIDAGSDGINVEGSVEVLVQGSIDAGQNGIIAAGDAMLTVAGDIEAGLRAVTASGDTQANVGGDISAGNIGVDASDNSSVTVAGGISAEEIGVQASDTAYVRVSGTITADEFVSLEGEANPREFDDYDDLENDYRQYTNGDAVVWVLGPVSTACDHEPHVRLFFYTSTEPTRVAGPTAELAFSVDTTISADFIRDLMNQHTIPVPAGFALLNPFAFDYEETCTCGAADIRIFVEALEATDDDSDLAGDTDGNNDSDVSGDGSDDTVGDQCGTDDSGDAGTDEDADSDGTVTPNRTPASGPKTGDIVNYFMQIALAAALVATFAAAGLARTREQS